MNNANLTRKRRITCKNTDFTQHVITEFFISDNAENEIKQHISYIRIGHDNTYVRKLPKII